ncbi:Zinc finger protein 501 [Eumeta japonica]|uniref:Zinc finger protein 501 n=1 Tax=Eumeta variegata TaxID=151549 RepID=A0A4C1UDZ0_EUMVA|nr:Zinc finger protein 501 [Eumeta japonica]
MPVLAACAPRTIAAAPPASRVRPCTSLACQHPIPPPRLWRDRAPLCLNRASSHHHISCSRQTRLRAYLAARTLPFPPDENKEEIQSTFGDDPATAEQRAACFSPGDAAQYPAYFKDTKGLNHAVFGSGLSLQYLKGGKLPDMLGGRAMPLYVRCPICQKEFKQKSTLLQHGCIHIESRPYPCPECGKRFRQQSHLTQHLRIHTNEKPYGCVYCPRFFRQRTILNQHLRIHTGEKPYKCTQCGKDFRQKAILDQHTRTHQGDRPFCCPMPNCRRRFATEPEVKKHIDNHMNPHAAKARRTDPAKAGTPRPLPPAAAVVKPELYFPQCYAPPFQQFATEFKPAVGGGPTAAPVPCLSAQ